MCLKGSFHVKNNHAHIYRYWESSPCHFLRNRRDSPCAHIVTLIYSITISFYCGDWLSFTYRWGIPNPDRYAFKHLDTNTYITEKVLCFQVIGSYIFRIWQWYEIAKLEHKFIMSTKLLSLFLHPLGLSYFTENRAWKDNIHWHIQSYALAYSSTSEVHLLLQGSALCYSWWDKEARRILCVIVILLRSLLALVSINSYS